MRKEFDINYALIISVSLQGHGYNWRLQQYPVQIYTWKIFKIIKAVDRIVNIGIRAWHKLHSYQLSSVLLQEHGYKIDDSSNIRYKYIEQKYPWLKLQIKSVNIVQVGRGGLWDRS